MYTIQHIVHIYLLTYQHTNTHNKTIFQIIYNIKFNAVEIGFDQMRNNLEWLYELFQAIVYILHTHTYIHIYNKLLFCEIIHQALPPLSFSLHKSKIMTCNSHSNNNERIRDGVRLFAKTQTGKLSLYILYYYIL